MPQCAARRTNDTAARLVDDLLPAVPYRQWVLSFPFQLRFALARNQQLFGRMVSTFLGIVFAWQRHRGLRLGIADGQTGSVTFLQRFGGALNLNPHAHCAVPDGLFVPPASGTGSLTFVPLPPPTDEEVALLTQRIARRLTDLAQRILGEDGDDFDDQDEEQAVLRRDLAGALTPPPGAQTTMLPAIGFSPPPAKPLSAVVNGFSLHAARTVDEEDREGLERLCRYGLRSPFSQERLSLLPDGRVVYRLAKPWPTPTGCTELVLDPVDFLRRLAALIPAPYLNMVRYHGVFANRSHYRRQLPAPPTSRWAEPSAPSAPCVEPDPATAQGAANQDQEPAGLPPQLPSPPPSLPIRRRRTPWATLLRRVFDVDALRCPNCLTPMVVLAFITDPGVLGKILDHLGLPTTPPPVAPARLPIEVDLPLQSDDELWDQTGEEAHRAAAPCARFPPAPS